MSGILVVDDDPDTCASMSDIIAEMGYEVDVAHNGDEALELSRHNRYGLALLDYKLPGMSGVEIFNHLKHGGTDTVGILVTASAADSTVASALAAGIRKIVPKPVDFSELVPVIEKVMCAEIIGDSLTGSSVLS